MSIELICIVRTNQKIVYRLKLLSPLWIILSLSLTQLQINLSLFSSTKQTLLAANYVFNSED